MDDFLGKMGSTVGVDVEKEVLAGLAGTVGMYASLPQGGGLYPELVLMATVKDPAAYEKVLTRLTEGIVGAVNEEGHVIARARVMDWEGAKLHVVELQKAHGKGVVPFTPSWALVGDRLALTLVPYTLKDLVWRVAHPAEAGPGLDAQEDFRALWAGKPASAGAFEYFDLQAVLSLLYDTGVPLLQTIVKPNLLGEVGARLPLDWSALPPARLVRPYFRSMMSFATWGADGIELRLNAPIPVLPIAFGVGAAAALVTMRHGGMMRETSLARSRVVVRPAPAPEAVPGDRALTRARADLDELMRVVRLFALDKNRLPATLDDLVTEHFLESVRLDPWDHAYRLVVTDAKTRAFKVVSDGPDGRPGTPDDVAVAAR
jgi:hypothetical protein